MDSKIKVITRENGEIQRVHVVRWEDWYDIDFLPLKQNSLKEQVSALQCFRDIYHNYLIPGCPWIFRQMVMFSLPDDIVVDKLVEEKYVTYEENASGEKIAYYHSEKYGCISDRLTIASIILQKGVRIKKGKPVFLDMYAEKLWHSLELRGCVHIVGGKLPGTQIIPVKKEIGYLSKEAEHASVKANANFFIMDPIDCATIYDQVGTTLGFCAKKGKVTQPPLFKREAFLVKTNGEISISSIDVRSLQVDINGTTYIDGENATFYTRPERAKTPYGKGKSILVIGDKVVAVKARGSALIPTSGFVIYTKEDCNVLPGDTVLYRGMEDLCFGIQVGNSIVRDGRRTKEFISKFYNIRGFDPVPFPPSLYPLDFEKARAARMALGADRDGKPVLFWAEGAGKLKYTLGEDSTGASLSEMADIAQKLDLLDAVNLDGGGSAQILIRNERLLRISDRNTADNSDAERLVPMGLIIR